MNEHEALGCYDRILLLFRQRVRLASGEISPSLDLTGARSTGTGCERGFFRIQGGGGRERKFRLIQEKKRKRVVNKQTSSEMFYSPYNQISRSG